jgi:hypothetical protein
MDLIKYFYLIQGDVFTLANKISRESRKHRAGVKSDLFMPRSYSSKSSVLLVSSFICKIWFNTTVLSSTGIGLLGENFW